MEELIFWIKDDKQEIHRSLFPFITLQKELKVVRLIISEIYVEHEIIGPGIFNTWEEAESFKAKITAFILKNCHNLKELDIVFEYSKEFNGEMQYDSQIAQTFAERIPQLKSLSLSYFNWCKWLPPKLPENSSLQSLQFPENQSSCDELLKSNMCCNLQYLDLPKCNLNLLNDIAQFQVRID